MSDPYIASTLIAPYLAQLASPAPTPGGGSACAAVGAIGAALIEMVINVSLRSAHPEHIDELHTELQIATEARARFVVFGTMDERAYNGYRVALALPKSSDEEKVVRRDALEKATIASAEAPLQTAMLAESLLKRIFDVTKIASSHMRSDLGVAAHMLASARIRSNCDGRHQSHLDQNQRNSRRSQIETNRHRIRVILVNEYRPPRNRIAGHVELSS